MNNSQSEAAAVNAIPSEKILYRLQEKFGSDRARIFTGRKFRVGVEASRAAAFPHSIEELSEMLRLAGSEKWRVIPAGAGSWLQAGNRPAYFHLIISTTMMNRISEYEPSDLTATVEAGAPLKTFNETAREHRQFIPLDPFGVEDSTIGAVISTASSGPLRCAYGTPRDWLIGICVVHADGTITRAGGKVVKNVAGYDLCKLYTGSFGTLGIIAEMSFKLRAIPPAEKTLLLYSDQLESLCSIISKINGSELQPSALELLSQGDETVPGDPGKFTLAVRLLHEPDAIESQINELLKIAVGVSSSVLSNGDARTFWNNYRASEIERSVEFDLKLSGLPSDLMTSLDELRSTLPETRWRAHAANGVIRIHADHQWLDEFKNRERARKLKELRLHAQSRGGQLVIFQAPDELLEKLDVWGDVGPTADLMRTLKSKFDPDSLLNTGRFVAGI